MYSFLGGVLIGVFGQGLSSLGLVLMKKSHNSSKAWYKNIRWYLSFLVFISGNISNAIALSLAPQSVISALPVLVLVYNSIWAPLFLKEKLHRRDFFGILVTVAGVLLVVVFGPKTEGDYDNATLLHFFKDKVFIIYGSIVLSITVISCLLNVVIQKNLSSNSSKSSSPPTLKFATSTPSSSSSSPKKDTVEYGLLQKAAAISASISPAILSSFNAILSKIVGELVVTTIKSSNQFNSWHPYMFILALIVTNTTQIILLQKALANFQALQIIPTYQALLTIFAVIGGGIYFQEFLSFMHKPIYFPILFGFGLLFAVIGVMILPQRGADTKDYSSSGSGSESEEELLLEKENSPRNSKLYDEEAPFIVYNNSNMGINSISPSAPPMFFQSR